MTLAVSRDAGMPAFTRTAVGIDIRVRHLLPVLAATRPEEG